MLCMETIGKIARLSLRDGESISSLAQDLKLSRNMVKRYSKKDSEPGYRRKTQTLPQLRGSQDKLKEWLELQER